MRVNAPALAFILALGFCTCGCAKFDIAAQPVSGSGSPKPATVTSSVPPPAKVDFATQIRPILESRCTPCHFEGGRMYQRLPFDRPETIKALGTKLFTRIKDEKEQRLIREYLSQ